MAKHRIEHIEWREVVWQRPFSEENVIEMLTHLATLENRGAVWHLMLRKKLDRLAKTNYGESESCSSKEYPVHVCTTDTDILKVNLLFSPMRPRL